MLFEIDKRISSICFELGDWPLSRVFLRDNANYPWLILVPRLAGILDIEELDKPKRHLLIDEISQLSSIVRSNFKPDKLNVGALGNIVSQLHVHIIARFTHDDLWPHGIWQAQQKTTPYPIDKRKQLIKSLRHQIETSR